MFNCLLLCEPQFILWGILLLVNPNCFFMIFKESRDQDHSRFQCGRAGRTTTVFLTMGSPAARPTHISSFVPYFSIVQMKCGETVGVWIFFTLKCGCGLYTTVWLISKPKREYYYQVLQNLKAYYADLYSFISSIRQ